MVDCPSGRLETVARVESGDVKSVRLRNVPRTSMPVTWRRPAVDVAFGGAFYAFLEERVAPAEVTRLIELGRAIKAGLEWRA